MAKDNKPRKPDPDQHRDDLEPLDELSADDVVDLRDEGTPTLQFSGSDDESIDLGAPGEPSPSMSGMSGMSGVNWADLANQAPPATGHGAASKIDAPSDADLRVDETLTPGADRPHTTVRSGSPPTLIARNQRPADFPPEDSGSLDLSALHQEASEMVVPGAARGATGDSGIDLIEERLLSESKHDLQLSPDADTPSGRDLIAEAVESGVDLANPQMEIVDEEGLSGSINLAQPPADDALSSTVNLGGPAATRHANLLDMEAAAMHSDSASGAVDLEGFIDGGSGASSRVGNAASEVDLGGRPVGGKESSSLREEGEAVSDSDENFSGAISSGRGISTIDASPDSMVRVAEQPPPEEEISLDGDDEDDDAKPAKPGKKQPVAAGSGGGKGGWLGGSLIGALAGAGACIGLGFADINLPSMTRDAILGAPAPAPKVPTTPTIPSDPTPVIAAISPQKLIQQGDFEEAGKAGIEQVEETKPEQLALRGEYRWLSYLKAQRIAKTPLKADDPAVAKALEDLAKANTPDAAFWMGHIQETTGNVAAARKTFADAAEKNKADAAQRRRFEAALHRLDLRAAQQPAAATGASRRGWTAEEATLAALLLVTLQDQPAPPPAAPGAPAPAAPAAAEEEAGPDFWAAVKAARDQKFADALKAIDKAKALHETNRFVRLRKAQNPLTDPTEEIFLKTCDELKAYFDLQDKLAKGGYLAEQKNPAKAVEELLKNVAETGDAAKKLVDAKIVEKPEDFGKGLDQLLTERKAIADLADKLVKDKVIEKPEDLAKGVEKLAADKKAANAVGEKLATEKIIEKPEDLAKGVDALLAAKKAADAVAAKFVAEKIVEKPELDKAFEQVVADRKAAAAKEKDLAGKLTEADAFVKQVADELGKAKFLEKAEKAQVLPALKRVLELAAMKDPQGTIRALETQVGKANERIKSSRSPQEMLALWLPQLQFGNRTAAEQSAIDAQRVLRDPDATPDVKTKAETLLALGAWSRGDFTTARPALEKAKASLGASDTLWQSSVDTALRDASNPADFYLSNAAAAERGGQTSAPLLAKALEVLPEAARGPIYLRKAELQLQAARSKHKGRVPATDPDLVAARKDADAAAKAGLAAGHHLLGQIAEETGAWAVADKSYRDAIKASPKLDEQGSRYRIALARLLLRDKVATRMPTAPFVPPAPQEKKPEEKKPEPAKPEPKKPEEKKPEEKKEANLGGPGDLGSFVAMLTLAYQAGATPVDPSQAEALRLADEILAMPEAAVPFEVRAHALAIKGQYTRALSTYVDGLRPHLKREHADGLMELVHRHPTLKRPESLATPNGFEAERHYAAGLRHYFARNYTDAEKELESAIANDNQDARLYYFLGLAKLAQRKRDAIEEFEQGAKLEQQARPGRDAVSAALERIQGRNRRVLNEIRDQAR